jgi:hypothetical protein
MGLGLIYCSQIRLINLVSRISSRFPDAETAKDATKFLEFVETALADGSAPMDLVRDCVCFQVERANITPGQAVCTHFSCVYVHM